MTEQQHVSTANTVTTSRAYDSLARLTSTTDINNNTVSYGYDTRNDLTSIVLLTIS